MINKIYPTKKEIMLFQERLEELGFDNINEMIDF